MAPHRTAAAAQPHGTGYKLLCWNCLHSNNLRKLKGYADSNSLRKHQGRYHNCWSDMKDKVQCSDCLQWCEGVRGLAEHKNGQKCDSDALKANRVARPIEGNNSPLYKQMMADLFDFRSRSSTVRMNEELMLVGDDEQTIADPQMGKAQRVRRRHAVLQRYAGLIEQHGHPQLPPTQPPVAGDLAATSGPALAVAFPFPTQQDALAGPSVLPADFWAPQVDPGDLEANAQYGGNLSAPPPPAVLLQQQQQLPLQPALGDWETLQTSGLSALGYPESQVPHPGYYPGQSTGLLPAQGFEDAADGMAAPWQDLLAPMAPQTAGGVQYDSSAAVYTAEMPQQMYESASEPSLHFPTPDGTPELANPNPALTFAPLDGAEMGQQLEYDGGLGEIVGSWPCTAPLQDPSGGQMYAGTIPDANTAIAAPEMPLQYSFDFGQPAGAFLQDPSNAAAAAGMGAGDFTDTFATVGAGNQQPEPWDVFDFSGL